MWEWIILATVIIPMALLFIGAIVADFAHVREYGYGDEVACQLYLDGRLTAVEANALSHELTQQHMASRA